MEHGSHSRKKNTTDPTGALALGRLRSRFLGFDVFVSYAQDDSLGYAMALENRLSRLDLTCFRDAGEIPAGSHIRGTIQWALAKSQMMVVVISQAATHSKWVEDEIESFTRTNRTIVPIAIEGVNIPDKWTFIDENVHITEMYPNLLHPHVSDDTVDRIQHAISFKRRNLLGRWIFRLILATIVSLMLLFVHQYSETIKQRDLARIERDQAEELVEYMTKDLKDALKPIYKLKLLEEPARKAVDYFLGKSRETPTRSALERLELRWRTVRNLADVNLALGDIGEATAVASAMVQLAAMINEQSNLPTPVQRAMLAYSHRLIGDIHAKNNELPKAKDEYKKARTIYENALGIEEPNKAIVQGIIGLRTRIATLAEREGDLEGAIVLHKVNLDFIEEFAGVVADEYGVKKDRLVALKGLGDNFREAG